VDYEGVSAVKRRVFERLFRAFVSTHLRPKTPRGLAFQAYTEQEGEALLRFAVFQALQEHFGGRSWHDWPTAFHRPDSSDVLAFLRERQQRVDLYRYLQWQCDLQLQIVEQTARRAGMPIGLYLDFAVGIDPHGADAWSFQDHVIRGASIGAPPDLFSPRGQNWGLSPPDPDAIRQRGVAFLAEGFRRSTRHCGILRLDHAMGLFRLFWVPEGRSATEGAYVAYPAEDLLGVLAIESRQQDAIIVGEDLGTVTPEIRRRLMQRGLLSSRLLLFEKSRTGFLPPHRYPTDALTSFTTHDLPTLAGFWAGRDIEMKQRLGLYPDQAVAERDRKGRAGDRRALLNALAREHLLPARYGSRTEDLTSIDATVSAAVYRYLARTPSWMVAVPLEDLLGDVDTPNIPGADPKRYPVWRVKAGPPGSTMEHYLKSARVRAIARAMNAERPRADRKARSPSRRRL
jgi:4-alpha-glucanotransferase